MKQNRWIKALKLFMVIVCCSLCVLSFTTCSKEKDDFDEFFEIPEIEYGCRVYPNPATNCFTVCFSGLGDGETNIQLFNAVGQQVYATIVDADGYVTVPVGNLSSGNYLLWVFGSDRTYTTKVIVN